MTAIKIFWGIVIALTVVGIVSMSREKPEKVKTTMRDSVKAGTFMSILHAPLTTERLYRPWYGDYWKDTLDAQYERWRTNLAAGLPRADSLPGWKTKRAKKPKER